MDISSYLVYDLFDAQLVRMIRNELRSFMTQNTNFITSETQEQWFNEHLSTNNQLFLYCDEFGAPIGYGYIRYQDDMGKAWGTLAVMPEFQSQGYGTEIYKHLLSLVDELYIEIFADNNASLIAALKAGFVIRNVSDKTITLVVRKG